MAGRAGIRLSAIVAVEISRDGMQEVRGSNLLSSTGQKHNSNRSNSEYSSKVQQRRPDGPPYVCSDRASSSGWGCWQDTGFQALNRRWSACHLGKSRSRRSRDPCHLVTTRPSWRAIPASDCCRICKWSSRAGRPGGPVHSQEPRLLARAAFADGRLGARARRVAPMVSVRRWAHWCAAPLRRRVAPWRSPARLPARWCAT